MAEQSAKAVRTETEKAALQLLRERANLVGEAATARHERDQLAEALREASTRYAARYADAVAGGWTADDLAKLGLDAPESSGTSRRRRAPRQAQPVQDRPDGLVTPADVPAQA
ncbi:hypothetical protein GA0070606_0026 [Micromonospora citrea]|uniref:Uncharacterized protein n=1 Tax=Micromonospora citrea TaxID=47855 RepID=A0A1C6TPU4_9ACTN|nr:hypothetical protein [Micromonospora citrea]SCL43835.1 hypothetical protein GA0070606_0026 [Micromonospora citrea]